MWRDYHGWVGEWFHSVAAAMPGVAPVPAHRQSHPTLRRLLTGPGAEMPNVVMPICAWEKRSQPFTHAASMDRMGTPSGREWGGVKPGVER